MVDFKRKVRYSKIPGPNQKGFNRGLWQSYSIDPSITEEDKKLVEAGLFFDDILSFLRSQKSLQKIFLRPSAIARLTIAVATANLLAIAHKSMPKSLSPDKPRVVTSDLVEMTVVLPTGETYTPDELITGMGDGMKHIFRDLRTMDPSTHKPNEFGSTKVQLKQIWREFNLAICYQTAAEYWMNCLGNGYVLEKRAEGVALIPSDRQAEIARTVSTYRRSTMALHENIAFVDEWLHSHPSLSRVLKEKLCGIPLVRRISGGGRIDHIELGLGKRVLDAAAKEIASQASLMTGCYKDLLGDPLPNLSGFTIAQITNAWRLLQSLANTIFTDLKKLEGEGLSVLLQCAPQIPKQLLWGTLAKALSLSLERAGALAEVLVFDGSPSRDLWAQPLIECEEDYCLVIPCILSVNLLRIVETWMRQGGLDLERRGPELEQFCRSELREIILRSPLKRSIQICQEPIVFKPQSDREEEIDLVIILGETILLLEVKCILWPDDAIQIANYRDTVEKAAAQIARKRKAVIKHYPTFSERLSKGGYKPPEKASILGCVLTNSAVFSGFPINNVPIIDLAILRSFLINEHVRSLERDKGKIINKKTISFYTDLANAMETLPEYLLNPPQLDITKQSVMIREVAFPLESPSSGKLVYETYSVELDVKAFSA